VVIAVFEDDLDCAARLETIIRQCTHYPTAINTEDAREITDFADRTPGPALYLLDIIKEGCTAGFQIAEHITRLANGSLIVFLTAYPQRISGNAYFKTKAFSFIYKDNPSLEQELRDTIRLAEQAMTCRCILIHAGRYETLYVPYESINYIEAVKGTGKLCIHCEDGQYVIRETLGNMSKLLAPHGFTRCHRSVIINLGNRLRVDKSGMTVHFPNGASCPYSNSMKRWPE